MKRQASQSTLERYQQEIAKQQASKFVRDERYWRPVTDKTGAGSALIRFLPPSANEDVPFVRIWSYGWKNPKNGQWYIEESLFTLNRPDPMMEYNNDLWNTGETGKATIRLQGMQQKLGYISNIQVLKHPGQPEDDGKVFLYRYGKQIFDKIDDRMNPPVGLGIPALNPFDFWKGASFSLQIVRKEVRGKNFPNYESSQFITPAPLSADDDELKVIWEKQYPLLPEVAENKFKSYEDLKKRLWTVLGIGTADEESGKAEAKPVEQVHFPTESQRAAATGGHAFAVADGQSASGGEGPPWDDVTEGKVGEAEREQMAFFQRLASKGKSN